MVSRGRFGVPASSVAKLAKSFGPDILTCDVRCSCVRQSADRENPAFWRTQLQLIAEISAIIMTQHNVLKTMFSRQISTSGQNVCGQHGESPKALATFATDISNRRQYSRIRTTSGRALASPATSPATLTKKCPRLTASRRRRCFGMSAVAFALPLDDGWRDRGGYFVDVTSTCHSKRCTMWSSTCGRNGQATHKLP
jgi:hypothetical protein